MNRSVGAKMTIVLYVPRRQGRQTRGVCLSLLAICRLIDRTKYRISIIADNLCDDPLEKVMEESGSAVCLGITCTTGTPIIDAIEVARMVKEKYATLPIVWGGWHPTLCPDSTLESPWADIVVRGQGEVTFAELVNALTDGKPLENILGISYKSNGEIFHNPARPVADINSFPPLPYELVDTKSVLWRNRHSSLVIDYTSSYGCPFNCGFCCEPSICQRQRTALDAPRIVDDWERLSKDYGVDAVEIADNLFFLDEGRVQLLCESLLKKNLRIKWCDANGRITHMLRYQDETWELMKKAGCTDIFVGAESGFQEALDFVSKGLRVEETVMLAEKCRKHDIPVEWTMLCGLPWEADQRRTEQLIDSELRLSLDLARKLYSMDRRNRVTMLPYTPYPGSELYDKAVKRGMKTPHTLEEWTQWTSWGIWQTERANMPWLTAKQGGFVRLLCNYIMPCVPLQIVEATAPNRRWDVWQLVKRTLIKLYFFLPRLRFKHNLFYLAVDYWLYFWIYKVMKFARRRMKASIYS